MSVEDRLGAFFDARKPFYEAVNTAKPGDKIVYYRGITPTATNRLEVFGAALKMAKHGMVALFQRLETRNHRGEGVYRYEAHRLSATAFEKLDSFQMPEEYKL